MSALTLLLVRKPDVICSGRMEPNLERTVAFCMEMEEEVSLLLGDTWEVSGSRVSLRLLTSECEAALTRREAERVRSGWTLLSPEVLSQGSELVRGNGHLQGLLLHHQDKQYSITSNHDQNIPSTELHDWTYSYRSLQK